MVETISGETYVLDGDTVRVTTSQGKITVRLKGIAAPEMRDEGGPEAFGAALEVIGVGTTTCALTEERTYKRRVGVCVTAAGNDVAEHVMAAGWARDCPRYSGGAYAHAEKPQAAFYELPGYCKTRGRR